MGFSDDLRKQRSRKLKRRARRIGGQGMCQRFHALKRARQRYGIALTLDEIASMIQDIRKAAANGSTKDVQRIETQTRNASLWKIDHKGTTMFPVYDKKHKSIRTFLAPEHVDQIISRAVPIDERDLDEPGECRLSS